MNATQLWELTYQTRDKRGYLHNYPNTVLFAAEDFSDACQRASIAAADAMAANTANDGDTAEITQIKRVNEQVFTP